MNFEEFLKPCEKEDQIEAEPSESIPQDSEIAAEEDTDINEELDVQKAVVESLAAEKVAQDEHIVSLRKLNNALRSEISELQDKISSMREKLENVGDMLAANSETKLSNKVALLDRMPEVKDFFPGESRDHVLEVIREARDQAERDGRLRRAQILEAVLQENEPEGERAKRRATLEKLFADNHYVINGQVINKLDNLDISYKCGENYLLPSEIISRNY